MSNPKPFHPVGLPGTQGGVAIEENKVVLRNAQTGQVEADRPLPSGMALVNLYRDQKLFDLFPEQTWYVGLPWTGKAELTLVRLERERLVDGVVSFKQDQVFAWDAEVRYPAGPVWEFNVPLPPDYPYPIDFGLRFNLAETIYRFIGASLPAVGKPGDSTVITLSNVFSAVIFQSQPFKVFRFDTQQMEKFYGWQNR